MSRSSSFKRSGAGAALLVALATASGGCRIPVGVDRPAGVAPQCKDGVCVDVVFFESHLPHVGIWLEAPPATRLINARAMADAGPPCQGQFPIEWVKVDHDLRRTGPVDVSGAHGLVLEFPMNTWWSHSGLWHEMFVDLQLDVAGVTRCVRTRLTGPDGKEAVGL